jgi:hypothetical protein
MSGGHYNYNEARLGYIADQLEEDIKYNDIPWESPVKVDGEEYYGYQLSQETVKFMKDTVKQLRHLEFTIRQLDLVIEGDTSEENFRERVLDHG